MLQQTTVAAVIPYFERFLKRFPTVEVLAAAPEQEVLRCWEGLGYYSRARNIHRAAQQLIEQHGGGFPPGVDQLQELPGIGRYTAGAIVSFAFNGRAPIVEANTLRLYSRLLGYEGDPRSAEGQRALWDFAERVLPRRDPGAFNQALMDLGATVCTPAEPNCPACPLKTSCRAFGDGAQGRIPLAQRRPAITEVTEATIALRRGETFLLRRCPPGERWAGLWDFPRFAVEPFSPGPSSRNGTARALPRALRSNLQRQLRGLTGVAMGSPRLIAQLRHGVTRYRITLLCLLAECTGGELWGGGEDCRWVSATEFGEYPLSVTGRKFAKLLAATGNGHPPDVSR